MTEQLVDIIDDCLESVLAGRETIDSCCARYPHMEADLRPLLDVALASRAALQVEVSAEAGDAAREKFMARARQSAQSRGNAKRSRGFGRGLMLRPVALGASLLFLLSAGTALAATGAEPDSILYPLEQRLEGAHTALTLQKLDKAQVEVGHANERLDETEKMASAGKPEYIPDLLSRYDAHMDEATRLVREAIDEGEDAGQAEQMISATRDRLGKVVADINGSIPDEMRDAVREAANESNRDAYGPDTGASSGQGEVEDSTPNAPGGTGGGSHSGEPAGSDDGHGSGSSGGTSEPRHQDSPSYEPPHEDPPHQDTRDSHGSEQEDVHSSDLSVNATPHM